MRKLWDRLTEEAIKRGYDYLVVLMSGLAIWLLYSPIWGGWRAIALASCVALVTTGAIGIYKREKRRAIVDPNREFRESLRYLADQSAITSDGERLIQIVMQARAMICASLGENEAKLFLEYSGASGRYGNTSVAYYLRTLSDRLDIKEKQSLPASPPSEKSTP